MKTEISNKQTKHQINLPKIQRLVTWIMQQAQKLEPDRPWSEISVVLMDDASMAEMNQQFLGKPHATDVISFAYEPIPGTQGEFQGEVLVNVQRAVEEGQKRQGASRELALYVAHGCLHLTGANDDTDEARQAMSQQQDIWLKEADAQHLFHQLLKEESRPSS